MLLICSSNVTSIKCLKSQGWFEAYKCISTLKNSFVVHPTTIKISVFLAWGRDVVVSNPNYGFSSSLYKGFVRFLHICVQNLSGTVWSWKVSGLWIVRRAFPFCYNFMFGNSDVFLARIDHWRPAICGWEGFPSEIPGLICTQRQCFLRCSQHSYHCCHPPTLVHINCCQFKLHALFFNVVKYGNIHFSHDIRRPDKTLCLLPVTERVTSQVWVLAMTLAEFLS